MGDGVDPLAVAVVGEVVAEPAVPPPKPWRDGWNIGAFSRAVEDDGTVTAVAVGIVDDAVEADGVVATDGAAEDEAAPPASELALELEDSSSPQSIPRSKSGICGKGDACERRDELGAVEAVTSFLRLLDLPNTLDRDPLPSMSPNTRPLNELVRAGTSGVVLAVGAAGDSLAVALELATLAVVEALVACR